ncbi:MAG TPA: SPOR domain-containing protein [Rhodanobacter sp.]|nr:SPOR domain-containing protein [Rhodanobacter sp.]
MKIRLLGAAVLIALAVLFIPMFFPSSPPSPAGDQTVSLAIPQAPDRDLQTRTMDLNPQAAVSSSASAALPTQTVTAPSPDQVATVTIDSNRPRDVETDPQAGRKPAPVTVITGSGKSSSQPVIPVQSSSPTKAKPAPEPAATPAVATKPAAPTLTEPKSRPAEPVVGRGSYIINLSAYASAAGAGNLQRRVRALGYPVTGHAITRAGQERTQVIAGPFETRAAAESARLKIIQSIPDVPAKLEQDASDEDHTPPVAASSGKPGGWAVQLAAVSSQADANALRDKLRANGFDGFVDSVQSGGKRLWRVRAGPQTQRADAQRVHDQIKARLGIDGNVVSVP